MLFQKEAKIREVLNQSHLLQKRMDTGFAPIGLDMPYRIIVANNPVNFVDPWGLYSDMGLFVSWFGISFGEYIAEQAWKTGKTPNIFETATFALTEALKQKYNLHGYDDPFPTNLDEFEPWSPWPIENFLDPYRDRDLPSDAPSGEPCL